MYILRKITEIKKTLQDFKAHFMGFWKYKVALAVASKNSIIEKPQNGELLTFICLCKKGIEIEISNIGVNIKKEDNIYSKTLKIYNYLLK